MCVGTYFRGGNLIVHTNVNLCNEVANTYQISLNCENKSILDVLLRLQFLNAILREQIYLTWHGKHLFIYDVNKVFRPNGYFPVHSFFVFEYVACVIVATDAKG